MSQHRRQTWWWRGCGPPSWCGAPTRCDPAGWCPWCDAFSELWGQTIGGIRFSAAPGKVVFARERGTERRPNEPRLHGCWHVHGLVSTHKLHSTEASHPQSADSVEVAQRNAGEEIGLRLQSAVGIKKGERKQSRNVFSLNKKLLMCFFLSTPWRW